MRVPRLTLSAALGAVAVAGACLAPQASASTIAVTNLGDSGAGSLRAAIAAASPGDTITIPSGQITLTSAPLAISKDLTIAGTGADSSVISGNDAWRVLTITGAPTVNLEGLAITHGNNEFGAGILAAGNLTLRRVLVSDNHSGGGGKSGFGGGIDFAAGNLSLIESSVTDNSAGGGTKGAGFGGGIEEEPPANSTTFALSLQRSSVSGNTAGEGQEAPGFGGGVNASSGFEKGQLSISLVESTIAGNRAGGGTANSAGFGGGIELSSGGAQNDLKMTLESSSVTGNAAGGGGPESPGFGGGIDYTSGGKEVTQSLIAVDSTIAGNAVGGGGSIGYEGALDFAPGTASLSFDTIAGNLTAEEAGKAPVAALALTATSTIADSIVAGNGVNCEGSFLSGGHNIDDGASCGFTAGGDRQNTPALLGSLGANGGPTATLIPQAGSPAIDGGPTFGCPRTDQRGVIRPFGAACDIGAVEVAPPNASTGGTSALTPAGAVLGGTAGDPSIAAGSVSFQYGTSSAYGSTSANQPLAAGASGVPFAAAVAGLTPHTTYHYRILASTPDGTVFGADRTFTTALPAPPVITALSQSHRRLARGQQARRALKAREAAARHDVRVQPEHGGERQPRVHPARGRADLRTSLPRAERPQQARPQVHQDPGERHADPQSPRRLKPRELPGKPVPQSPARPRLLHARAERRRRVRPAIRAAPHLLQDHRLSRPRASRARAPGAAVGLLAGGRSPRR